MVGRQAPPGRRKKTSHQTFAGRAKSTTRVPMVRVSLAFSGFRFLPIFGAAALAACSGNNESAIKLAVVQHEAGVEGEGELSGLAARLTRAATVEGLVAFDEQGRVIPALADRWIVTDDGLSYIFRLRDGDWADGDELTAASARKSLMTALRAVRGTPLALDLGDIDEVRVMAGRVIEIRLFRPMPYLLQLLAQPEMGLSHEDRGAGPMDLRREDASDFRLTPVEPSKLGLPEIENWAARTREVGLHVVDGAEAVRRFNDGEVDLVLGGRIEDFLLTRSVGILRGTIQLDPVIGLFGLQVMNDKGFLAEPSNREAIAMAIDREALIDSFGVGGWQPTTRLVTPSLDGDLGTIGERWDGQNLEQRRLVASGRVRAWMGDAPPAQPEGARTARGANTPQPRQGSGPDAASPGTLSSAPQLSVWLPQGEGSQILFARLAADMAAISIRLQRAEDKDKADLVMVDDVARYPRATWFLNRLSCADRKGLCSEEADARVADADMAQTPQERAALLTEAEMTGANIFIPFGTPIRWSLVRGSVNGFATNSWGWHPLMPLAWLPK